MVALVTIKKLLLLVAKTFKEIIKGFLTLCFLGALAALFVSAVLQFSGPLYAFIDFGLPGLLAWQRNLIIVGIIALLSYFTGKNLINRILTKIGIFRGNGKKLGKGMPALIVITIEGKRNYVPVLYRKEQGIEALEVVGEQSEFVNRNYLLMAVPTYPMPWTGFSFYVSPEHVLVVVNIPTADWLSNYLTFLSSGFEEHGGKIRAVPYLVWKKRHKE